MLRTQTGPGSLPCRRAEAAAIERSHSRGVCPISEPRIPASSETAWANQMSSDCTAGTGTRPPSSMIRQQHQAASRPSGSPSGLKWRRKLRAGFEMMNAARSSRPSAAESASTVRNRSGTDSHIASRTCGS